MKSIFFKSSIISAAIALVGCAPTIKEKSPVALKEQVQNQTVNKYAGLKHRVAIAAFEDKTGGSNNLFGQVNNFGSQAFDMLSAHLVQSGKVVLLERAQFDSSAALQNNIAVIQRGSALTKLKQENDLVGEASSFAGASALIYGSVIEFGTKTEWEDAGLSKTKRQIAHAKVALRLVDTKTGQAFYSEFGEADGTNETSQTFGFGGVASGDATLGDKALNGAIAKLVGNMLKKLEDRPWETKIVDTQSGIVIGAGEISGLKVGDILSVYEASRKIKNPSTGAMMSVPGKKIGQIKVDQSFGTSAVDEGSFCSSVNGGPFTANQEVRK
jgi:curli biogenesis system outer membrane secretion channel CsgG